MGDERPRGDNTVLRDLETWSKNGLDCNPLKTWQLLRETVNLQNTMSKMSMHDIKDALTRPEALKALKDVVPNAEAVRGIDIKLNEYSVLVEAMIDSISASSRQWREHEMDFVRNFKSLQQVKDEVANLTDDDLVAQALLDERGNLYYGDMALPDQLRNKNLPAEGTLDLDAKRAFLLKIRANIQYGYRKNFAKALRLAAYESDPDDADIRAMLALQGLEAKDWFTESEQQHLDLAEA